MNYNETKAVIERVKSQLTEFYNGGSWVTENFKTKVLSLEAADASVKIPGHSHSVAQLVAHLASWRNFAVQKLTGNSDFDITDNSAQDWPDNEWKAVRAEFESYHEKLLSAIENFPIDQWVSTVPGRKYSFLFMINGIVEHDYYHYGQIGSLMAAIKKNER
jgi:Mycothiol maleylpyruvate isomerase N-terminal domain.